MGQSRTRKERVERMAAVLQPALIQLGTCDNPEGVSAFLIGLAAGFMAGHQSHAEFIALCDGIWDTVAAQGGQKADATVS